MITSVQIGTPAIPFNLPDQNGKKVNLSDYTGKWVVVYFYPKDDTPGCTIEAKDFTTLEFEKLAVVVGISPDSTESHCDFIAKYNLNVKLLSDPEHKVIEEYGAWQLKNNFGREYYGVVRSTFLIDPQGNIAHIWTKVTADGHALEVLNKLKSMQ